MTIMTAGSKGRLGAPCSTCGMVLNLPIAQLSVATVGLYDDARFPGRCLLVLDQHVENLEDVEDATMASVVQDLRRVARAIKSVTGAPRLNYAVLGNTEPHVHWHVIPRYPTDEALPRRAPWEDPRPRARLTDHRRDELMSAIERALAI